jgi:hypothetical protein
MAQFKNISGQDRDLSLPDWYEPRRVLAGDVVEIADDVAKKYDLDQPGVWEPLDVVTTSKGK